MNRFIKVAIAIGIIIIIFLIVRYLLKDSSKIKSGINDGKNEYIIPATELESNNGISNTNNFAYSCWFYVSDWNYRYGEPKIILGRMGSKSSDETSIPNVSGLYPCPVILLGAVDNSVSVFLDCYPGIDILEETTSTNSIVHNCTVRNVPLQKWVHLVVSVYGRTLDVYLDGKLVKTCLLPGIAKINPDADVYITPKGGFNGWTSNIHYYAKPINPEQAWNLYTKGFSGKGMLGSFISTDYSTKIKIINNTDNSESEFSFF